MHVVSAAASSVVRVVCAPSRASLATGDYVHRIGYWDSATAYDGRVPSWHHRVRDAGHDMASIGKLHYRGAADDNGMSEVHHPICIVDGIGDTHGLLRRDKRVREVARELAEEAGRGWSPYTRYDTKVADATVRWLHERKDRRIRGNNPSNWVAGEVSRCSVRARLMGRGLALRCLRGGGEEPGTCGCAAEGGHRVAARRAQLAAALIAGEVLPFLLSGYANQFSTLRLAKPAKSSVLRVIKVKSFIVAIAAIWPSA